MRLPTKRKPTHAGEILKKDFLEPMGITQSKFAKHLGWTYARINEIVNGKRGVSADTALAFAEAFNMEAEFWLNLQLAYDLWHAKKNHKPVSQLLSKQEHVTAY